MSSVVSQAPGAGSDRSLADGRIAFYRHPLPVRLTHWLNALCLGVLLMSGLQILNAHPALYWGDISTFSHPWMSFGSGDAPAFPGWITLPGYQDLAGGRSWHFFFAWLFVLNGLGYLAYAFMSRHFSRDLLPKTRDLKNLGKDFVDHLRLRFPKGEDALHYNVLQKLAYFTVIFILGPLIVLTGLTMSPTMNTALPELLFVFGGRQSARTIHFLCAFGFVIFFVVHMVMVLLSGPLNNLRAIITGRYGIEAKDG